jgi:hypothetical protein
MNKEEDIKVVLKVYPSVGENRYGIHVGNIKTAINNNVLPFSHYDDVDLFIRELNSYVSDRYNPKKYFANKSYNIKYKPPRIEGGKYRKSVKKTKKNKKSKKMKRKTYKR